MRLATPRSRRFPGWSSISACPPSRKPPPESHALPEAEAWAIGRGNISGSPRTMVRDALVVGSCRGLALPLQAQMPCMNHVFCSVSAIITTCPRPVSGDPTSSHPRKPHPEAPPASFSRTFHRSSGRASRRAVARARASSAKIRGGRQTHDPRHTPACGTVPEAPIGG